MKRTSILIVEDNFTDALLIKEQLNDNSCNQYDVEVVETLTNAIERLKSADIDVVLLDLSLPDSSGLDTVRTLVTKYPNLVIIVLTGLQDEQVALQSVRYGAQDFIEKNQITSTLLTRSISYSIERKKASKEKERLLGDLAKMLEQLEALQEMLPICAACRRIRDNDGNWQPLDSFIKKLSPAAAHCICPDCYAQFYPSKNKMDE